MNFFDLHCDTATECYEKNTDLSGGKTAVSFGAAAAFEKWTQCFAIWIRDDIEEPFGYYRSVYSSFCRKIADAPGNLTPIITVEGGSLIENDISRLSELKRDGVSALTLTWNGKSRIASGIAEKGGLTPFGAEVIRQAESLGIFCDLSHLNPESFDSAVKVTKRPIATHSNCSAVFPHRRNLSDSRISEIARRGGLIGICCYPPFLGGDVFGGILANIRHLTELGFEDNIAFGSDFDGGDMSSELDCPQKIPRLFEWLYENGIPLKTLEKVFYDNAQRFFRS